VSDVEHLDPARQRRPGLEREAELGEPEREREARPDGRPEDPAGAAVDARRDVERHDRRAAGVEPFHTREVRARKRAGEAGAEERVDRQVEARRAARDAALTRGKGGEGPRQGRPLGRLDEHVGRLGRERVAGGPRVASQPVPAGQEHRPDPSHAGRGQVARQHKAVAAVVARAAEDDRPAGPLGGKSPPDGVEGRAAGVRHEGRGVRTAARGRLGVEP
jgi:hypothetical protein